MRHEPLETRECPVHGSVTMERYQRCPACLQAEWERLYLVGVIREARERLAATRIPDLFRGRAFDDFEAKTPAQKRVLKIVRDYVWNFPDNYASGRCLTFIGNVGTGKTLLASILSQRIVSTEFRLKPKDEYDDHGRIFTVRYVTASGLIRKIKDEWGKPPDSSKSTAIERFTTVALLVLDEVGALAGTEFERTQLHEIVDLRYQAALPTLVITNCTREGLIHAIGEPAVDRLRDHGGEQCIFNWPSYRK